MDPESEQILQVLQETQPEPRICFNPERLDPADWKLEWMEATCGSPMGCTPDGCMGHTTDIPEALTIAGVRLEFNPDNYEVKADFSALRAVGAALNELITTAKQKTKHATQSIINLQTEAGLDSQSPGAHRANPDEEAEGTDPSARS
jgi:hypothetical protein